MHGMAAAMHMEGIDPNICTISLPIADWWRLYCALERKFKNMMVYDGRGREPDAFRYMGFKFVPRHD